LAAGKPAGIGMGRKNPDQILTGASRWIFGRRRKAKKKKTKRGPKDHKPPDALCQKKMKAA